MWTTTQDFRKKLKVKLEKNSKIIKYKSQNMKKIIKQET